MRQFAVLVFAATACWAALPPVQLGRTIVLPQGEAVSVADFVGKDGLPGAEGTVATIRWDEAALEIVFDCTDSAIADQVATERDSAKTWKDDSVGVLLEIGHGHDAEGAAVTLLLSAGGGLSDRRGKDAAYDCAGITSGVERVDGGWRATMRVPFAGLEAQPSPGDAWGLNLSRIDHQGRTYAHMTQVAWTPFAEHTEEINHWGHLIFAAPGATADDPLVVAAKTRLQETHTSLLARDFFPHRGHLLRLTRSKPAVAAQFHLRGTATPAQNPTTVTVSWDDSGLSFAFDCTDPAIVTAHTERDDIKLWKDDCVTAWIDPGHSHTPRGRVIMVQLGASGAVHDAGDGDVAYNVEGLESAVSRSDMGWQATVHLPWAGLRVAAPEVGDVWGLNLTRIDQPGVYDYKHCEFSTWAPVGKGFDQVDQWGHLVFAGVSGDEDDRAAAERMAAVHGARERALLGEGD